MDTVLVGGVGLLLIMGAVWQAQKALDQSSLSPRIKRVGGYALILVVIGAAVAVMQWHSSAWLSGTVQ